MSIRLRFACGHAGTMSDNPQTAPVCGCGETRITRTFARAPRFTGACSGPYATTRGVEPAIVNVAPGGALHLKVQEN